MTPLIDLKSNTDTRGSLTVFADANAGLPFVVKRVFCIHNVTDLPRGGHKHYETREAVICVKGSLIIDLQENGGPKESYLLDSPLKCLIIDAQKWRVLHSFSADATLVVLASNDYDPTDYIYDPNK